LTTKLRIGLDAHMVGSHETGNETYVVGLLDGLASLQDDFEVEVFHAGELAALGSGHLQPHRLMSRSPWLRLGLDLPMRSWRDRLDVLHVTYTAPVWSRCPIVLTVHDITFATNPEWFSARDLRVLSRAVPWSIRRAARVITVSEVCRGQIIERYGLPADRVVCVHNAAGPAAEAIERDAARNELVALGLDPGRPYILAVGNLQPRKNLVRLIEAYRSLAAAGVDVDLLVVGAEHYRAREVLDAAGEASGRVRFTGYISDRQLAACYTLATVFALPALFEGFGIPALEAMTHGTPVVCSRSGALPEVCGNAALYFDPTDVESITAALRRAVTDDALRDELIRKGRARAAQFSWGESAERTLSVYRSAALGRRA
jgi:glycosyltransferase involved in cell wall biosynthesis